MAVPKNRGDIRGPGNIRAHPAVRAWQVASPSPATPDRVETLKQQRDKSAVYRLRSGGVANPSIIAKRCAIRTGVIERTIHEKILPRLPISFLRYYGFVDEGDETCWLFLEDSEGTECSFENAMHRALVSDWMARLHASATRLAAGGLPVRDSNYYLADLRAARQIILDHLRNPGFTAHHREVLETILSRYRQLEARWGALEELCAGMPVTLVHGDIQDKNVHIRGSSVFVFDWEYAGWGLPAADLPHLDLALYTRTARASWPGLELASVRRWASVGRLFRSISSIGWTVMDLPFGWIENGIPSLRRYAADLRVALARLERVCRTYA
jgi:hypothetical protein